MSRQAIVLGLVCAISGAGVQAHDGLGRRLDEATARIERMPDDGAAYLARAELHRRHENWTAAFADLARAERHAADADRVAIARATALLDVGCPAAALAIVETVIARAPDHAVAHARRGAALERLGRPARAAIAYEQAVAASGPRRPGQYLRWCGALEAAGDLDGALEVLDRAGADLGRLVVLQERSIGLERGLGRQDAALARLDRLIDDVRRPEKWLALRADLLDECGRADDARAARLAALRAIERLPATRRRTGTVLALESSLRASMLVLAPTTHPLSPSSPDSENRKRP